MANLEYIFNQESAIGHTLEKVIASLHEYANEHYPLDNYLAHKSLEDIYDVLLENTESVSYKIGTRKHAMSIGVRLAPMDPSNPSGQQTRSYFFVDLAADRLNTSTLDEQKNAVIIIESLDEFKQNVNTHFTEKLLTKYEVFYGPNKTPLFEFEQAVAAGTIANTPIEVEKNKFMSAEELWQIPTQDMPNLLGKLQALELPPGVRPEALQITLNPEGHYSLYPQTPPSTPIIWATPAATFEKYLFEELGKNVPTVVRESMANLARTMQTWAFREILINPQKTHADRLAFIDHLIERLQEPHAALNNYVLIKRLVKYIPKLVKMRAALTAEADQRLVKESQTYLTLEHNAQRKAGTFDRNNTANTYRKIASMKLQAIKKEFFAAFSELMNLGNSFKNTGTSFFELIDNTNGAKAMLAPYLAEKIYRSLPDQEVTSIEAMFTEILKYHGNNYSPSRAILGLAMYLHEAYGINTPIADLAKSLSAEYYVPHDYESLLKSYGSTSIVEALDLANKNTSADLPHLALYLDGYPAYPTQWQNGAGNNHAASTQQTELLSTLSDVNQLLLTRQAEQWALKLKNATKALYDTHSLDSSLIPIFESITEKTDQKGFYEVSFYNQKNPSEVKRIITADSIFIQIKELFNALHTNPTTVPVEGRHLPFGTGLSLLFIAKLLIASEENFQWNRLNPTSEVLAKALLHHNYFNMAGLAAGGVMDVAAISSYLFPTHSFGLSAQVQQELASLVTQEGLNSFITAAKTAGLDAKPLEALLPTVVRTYHIVSRSANAVVKALPAVGVILNTISLVYDSYELVHNENKHQEKVFATSALFDGATLGLTLGGVLASAAGLAALSASLFIAAVPVGLIGAAVVWEMNNFDNIEQAIKHQVVMPLDQIAKAYDQGYDFAPKENLLRILEGAVVQKIDFETGKITFGSQYLLDRDPNDLKRVNANNDNAINLRTALKGKETITLSNQAKLAEVVLLPNTPKSYISYNIANIDAIWEYKGEAYKNIQQIEQATGGKFDLEEIRWVVYDSVVFKLFHQYKPTSVEIALSGTQPQVLVVPELPTQTAEVLNKETSSWVAFTVSGLDADRFNSHELVPLANAINYQMTGKGQQYTLVLGKGATFHLATEGTKSSKWVLNTNHLGSDDIVMGSHKLSVGGVDIHIDPVTNAGDQLFILKQDGDIITIDLNGQRQHVIQMDADKWRAKNPTISFDTHLQTLAKAGQLAVGNISIANYTQNTKTQTRVYFDPVHKDTLIQHLDLQGNLTTVGLNDQWLANRKNNWRQKLKELVGDQHVAISGLKQPAWFAQGKLIIAPNLSARSLELLDINLTSTTAYLFDAANGELYQQPISEEAALNDAFNENYHLDTKKIEKASPILSSHKIQSAVNQGNVWRIVTDEGLILALSDRTNSLHLVGVNQAWQKAHQVNLHQAMKSLANDPNWSHDEVVILQGDLDSTPAWYHLDWGRTIKANGLNANDKPQFIGTENADGNRFYVYINSTSGLHKYQYTNRILNGRRPTTDSVQRFFTAFSQDGTPGDDSLTPLALNGAESVILSGGLGEDTYNITDQAKQKLKRFIIDNHSTDSKKDTLKYFTSDYNQIELWHDPESNHLQLHDRDITIDFLNVFAENKALHNHLQIELYNGSGCNKTYQMTDLTNWMATSGTDTSVIRYLTTFDLEKS